jgi:predicted RND superfamily exporter protein
MRGWIVGAFLVLTVAGIYGATLIPNDPAIDRLVVSGDPVARATMDFDRLFPEGDQAVIMLEGTDPLSPAALRTADRNRVACELATRS